MSIKHTSVQGELTGALASAIPGLVHALTLGLLAFAPLGSEHAELGVRAGFAAVIFGGAAAALLSGTSLPATGPRASVSLILAAFVATLARDPGLATGDVLALVSLCVLGAGAIQVLCGVLRLGTIAKFVPYPVVGGFMCGVAVLIVLSQLPQLGLPALPYDSFFDRIEHVQPWPLAVGLATAVSILLIGRRWKRMPAALLGLVIGTLLHFALAVVMPGATPAAVIGELPAGIPLPRGWDGLHALVAGPSAAGHLRALVATALIIAIIGALDSLLAAIAIDAVAGTRHRANQELIAQGAGNVVSSLFGGVPVALSPTRAIPAYRAGGRTRAVGLIAAALLAAIAYACTPLLAHVPLAVLAGIMLTVAWGLVDGWTRGMMRRLASGSREPTLVWSAAVVVLVAATTVLVNFVVAVIGGVFLSMGLFIAAMNRSLLRSVYDAGAIPSRRIYGPEQDRQLAQVRRRIKVVELEGALFFGSTERLGDKVESIAGNGDYVVLDLARISAIDATGAIALEQIARRAGSMGARVLLAGIDPKRRHGAALLAYGPVADPSAWFVDADHAIEHAERALLGPVPPGAEIAFEQLALTEGLATAEIDRLRNILERTEVAAGETLFREGEAGDRLYVLARGAVTIALDAPGSPRRRIVTFAPGAIFGEAAMLDGRARSATAIIVEDAIVYALARADLDALAVSSPQTALKLLANLGHHLSQRLRHTTDTLRELTEARG